MSIGFVRCSSKPASGAAVRSVCPSCEKYMMVLVCRRVREHNRHAQPSEQGMRTGVLGCEPQLRRPSRGDEQQGAEAQALRELEVIVRCIQTTSRQTGDKWLHRRRHGASDDGYEDPRSRLMVRTDRPTQAADSCKSSRSARRRPSMESADACEIPWTNKPKRSGPMRAARSPGRSLAAQTCAALSSARRSPAPPSRTISSALERDSLRAALERNFVDSVGPCPSRSPADARALVVPERPPAGSRSEVARATLHPVPRACFPLPAEVEPPWSRPASPPGRAA